MSVRTLKQHAERLAQAGSSGIHKEASLNNKVTCFMTAKRRVDCIAMGLRWSGAQCKVV